MNTRRAFTVAVCTGCGASDGAVLDGLRMVVRDCQHGMLVAAACLFGSLFCPTRPGRGVIVMLQPCDRDRSPTGPARWVGPVADSADLTDLCEWVAGGEWDPYALPAHLQNPLGQLAFASRRN